MTPDLLERAAAIHVSVQRLATELKALRRERDKLQADLQKQTERNAELEKRNRTVQGMLDVNTLSKAVSIKQNPSDVRQRLNKLIKELDGVINYMESER
jgi:regulator of replication initiation timing